MITQALQFTNSILDQFLRNRFGLDESKVLLNNLIEGNGSIPEANQNKVIISLINIEKETTRPFYIRNQKLDSGNYSDISTTERFNLDLLLSTNFNDYMESLKFLDAIILFFQVNASVSARSFSGIPSSEARFEFEIEKLTYLQMQNLWTAMGAKYQPSVIYKMRLITVQGNEAEAIIPSVSRTKNLVNA